MTTSLQVLVEHGTIRQEGTALAVALHVIQPDLVASCDCLVGACTFTPSRVYWYMIVWRDAQILREPFEVVLVDCSRVSRDSDPSIKAGRIRSNKAQDIRLSLERARDEGHIPLTPWNAARIAAYLCPERYDETPC